MIFLVHANVESNVTGSRIVDTWVNSKHVERYIDLGEAGTRLCFVSGDRCTVTENASAIVAMSRQSAAAKNSNESSSARTFWDKCDAV